MNTTANPTRTYAADNTYSVTLTVTDGVGQVGGGDPGRDDRRAGHERGAGSRDQCAIMRRSGCGAFSGNGRPTRTVTRSPIVELGDGTATSTWSEPGAHTYAFVGTYTVTLTVTDGWGKAASITRVVIVT